MLSLRLPTQLKNEFAGYCKRHEVSKTEAAITALKRLLRSKKEPLPISENNPFAKRIGVVKGGPSTDELMRITRGDDWNRPWVRY